MANPVHVLDEYYLAITLLVTVAYQLFFFSIAFRFKFDKLTGHFAGGTNFVVLAILTLALSRSPDPRQIVASVFLVAWGLRLSLFLLYRVLRTGGDRRFDGTRDRFFPFLGFWAFQMLWVWTVSLPVTVLNSPAAAARGEHRPRQVPFGTGRDVAGVVLFAVGFAMESASDAQKFVFRSRNHDGAAICDRGFFGWSRHPNYFGEIIIQFCRFPLLRSCGGTLTAAAIYMICVSAAADGPVGGQAFKALYATIVGPFFLTILLMFVSGLPLSERPGAKKRYENGLNWEAYQRYLHRTSILIPFPPQIYEHLPTVVKRTLFLEFPMYVFDPAKHSDAAKNQETAGEQRRSGEALRDTA
ncbi:tubulin-dependent ATPase kip3 [Hypoxylon texense]